MGLAAGLAVSACANRANDTRDDETVESERPTLEVEPSQGSGDAPLDLTGVAADDLRRVDAPVAPPVALDADTLVATQPANEGSGAEGSGDGSGDASGAEDVECSKEPDGVCADGCTRDDDADCCELQGRQRGMWCSYDPNAGCACAIEGPFAPPSFTV